MSDFKIEKSKNPENKAVDPDKAKAVSLKLSDDADIQVGSDRSRISLCPDPEKGTYDPFDQYKTEPEKYFYYAVNVDKKARIERETQGFELIPDAVFGDLILARMPNEKHEKMLKKEQQKAKAQLRAPKAAYREEMKSMGLGDLVEEE
jgi:hypothetical protein